MKIKSFNLLSIRELCCCGHVTCTILLYQIG